METLIKKLLPILLLLLLVFPSYKHLLSKGYFPMHDDTQISRVFEMTKALKERQFPVRIVSDLGYGYGYPIFNFYAPFPYYIGSVFNMLSNDIVWSTKTMFLVGFILATISMYFLGKELGGIFGGITSSVLYTYAPYHGVNLYVRGSVGELYAYALLPLLLLAIIHIIGKREDENEKSGIWVGIGSLILALILLSHNILGLITLGFLLLGISVYLLIGVITKKDRKKSINLLIMFFLGVGLSAFFTLPAILESNQTKVATLIEGTSNFSMHFLYIDQLWNSPWGYAGSSIGRADGMSFMIGKTQIIGALIGLSVALWSLKKRKLSSAQIYAVIIISVVCVISVFMTLEISRIVWITLPYAAFIQYPWRFLNTILLSICVFAAFIGLIQKKMWSIVLAVMIIGVCIGISVKYFIPQYLYEPDLKKYTSKKSLNFNISKISDEYLPKNINIPKSENAVSQSIFPNKVLRSVKELKNTAIEKKYNIDVQEPTALTMNLIYLPGWNVLFKNNSIETKNHEGKLQIVLPKGSGELDIKKVNTPIQTIGNSISFLSMILLVYVTLFHRVVIWPKSRK